jgi:hypothetical protein
MVKGDLIVNNNDSRIKTRSRARQSTQNKSRTTGILADTRPDPDQYTIIPASLKIVKVLIEELLSAAGVRNAANAASAALASGDLEDEDDEDGWEDDDDILDLGLGATKLDLMGFADGSHRERDDETQAYLTEFFIACGRDNTADFQQWYALLNEEEKAKLNEVASGAGR